MRRPVAPSISPLICMVVPFLLMSQGLSAAQESPTIKVTRLTDHIYQLTTDQGSYTTNVLASVGDDGVLLVDTDAEETATELRKVVDSFAKGPPKYIINTHRHVEHVGGNAIFGATPIVISHELVRTKLRSGSYLFDEFPPETYPDITFTDSLSLYFNGEKIEMVALPGSHDDNEIIVHFTKSKVVHLSSLVNGLNFPSVDSDGDALKFPELVGKAIEMLPEDVIIVSGHNENCTWKDLHAYRDMLVKTTEIVRKGLAAGKDVATLQEEKVLDGWEAYAGSYVSPDDWIKYLASGLEKKERRKKVFEPLYYALKEGGPDAAVDRYFELKKHNAAEYDFTEMALVVIGDKLLGKDRIAAAIRMLELALEEYPDGKYTYYINYDLSSAYKKMGDKKSAIRHCEKALELKPDFQPAAKLLEELRGD